MRLNGFHIVAGYYSIPIQNGNKTAQATLPSSDNEGSIKPEEKRHSCDLVSLFRVRYRVNLFDLAGSAAGRRRCARIENRFVAVHTATWRRRQWLLCSAPSAHRSSRHLHVYSNCNRDTHRQQIYPAIVLII